MLSRGDDWVFAQNIGHVVKFLGLNEATGPVLSPAQLMERLDLFLRTAIQIVPQMPDALLPNEVPNRPRSYLALGHHLFRIPEGMLEVAAGAIVDQRHADRRPAGGHAQQRGPGRVWAAGAGRTARVVGSEDRQDRAAKPCRPTTVRSCCMN